MLVLGDDGRARARADRFTPAADSAARGRGAAAPRSAGPPAARRKTVIAELKRMRAEGAIDDLTYSSRREAYEEARDLVRRLSGARRVNLGAVVETLEDVAASGRLTVSRLPALWLTLERNRRWWTTGPLLAPGQRVGFDGSELVWQYYPGEGIQLQVLATFGKLNALWSGKRYDDRMGLLVDEVLPLAVERGGALAWEYHFPYRGGRAPWVSGMAQGTALQALARAAVKLGRQEEVWPVTSRALALFDVPAPEGVRVPAGDGVHYALYSFEPRLRVINGFIQALVGLFDYAGLAGDPNAFRLYTDGERRARQELASYDTGAWSLYSRGSVKRESDLGYHDLVRGFLRSLCTRTQDPAYCDTAERFLTYRREPPQLDLLTTRLRGGTAGTLRFRLSKLSAVSLRIARGDAFVHGRGLGTLGYGTRTAGWAVPRRPGEYQVQLTARDLAGNAATVTETVEVLRPRKPKARRD